MALDFLRLTVVPKPQLFSQKCWSLAVECIWSSSLFLRSSASTLIKECYDRDPFWSASSLNSIFKYLLQKLSIKTMSDFNIGSEKPVKRVYLLLNSVPGNSLKQTELNSEGILFSCGNRNSTPATSTDRGQRGDITWFPQQFIMTSSVIKIDKLLCRDLCLIS